MRILYVTPYFAPAWAYGGPSRSVYELARELARRGHEMSVLTTDALSASERASPSTEVLEDIEVHRFRNLSNCLAWRTHLFLPRGTASWIRARLDQFDIVHLHMYRTVQNLLVHTHAVPRGIPYVLSPRGSLPRVVRGKKVKALFDLFCGRDLLRDAGRLVALSKAEAAQHQSFGVQPARIAIVPNGLDATAYESLPEHGSFKAVHRLEGKPLVTYVGRLNARKGLEYLLAAFRNIAQNHDDVHLVLMGPDEPYKAELLATAEEWDLTERVTFPGMGMLLDKQAAYVDSAVVVYPAEHEAFGLVPFEALLCGVPVIVSNDSGSAEFLMEVDGGTAVPSQDIKALTDALTAVLQNRTEAIRAAQRGRQMVLDELNWGSVATQMEKVYESVLEEPSGKRISDERHCAT